MAKVAEFTVGYCLHPGCMALRGAGWRVCRFPSRVWLIEANNRRWLWDTGYARYFTEETSNGIFWLYRKITPVYCEPEEEILFQLASKGLSPGDISGIILSHFHGDHIAGLRDFPSVPAICSGEGWSKIRRLRGIRALKQAFIPGLIPADFETRLSFVESFERISMPQALAPFNDGYVLPESNREIILVPLPGHAPGQIGAFILTDNGWTLLASDAAWSPKNYQEMRGPAIAAGLIMDDSAAYWQTLKKLNQLWRTGQVDIRLCHEGDL